MVCLSRYTADGGGKPFQAGQKAFSKIRMTDEPFVTQPIQSLDILSFFPYNTSRE